MLLLELSQSGHELRPAFVRVGQHLLITDRAYGGDARSAGNRIAANVPPCDPTSHFFMSSSRLKTPDSGSPEAIPLATVMMSGTTPKCSKANHVPVRPKPDCTHRR